MMACTVEQLPTSDWSQTGKDSMLASSLNLPVKSGYMQSS